MLKGTFKSSIHLNRFWRLFFAVRLELYVKRKRIQLQNLQLELLKLDNKVRFVLGVVNGEIKVNNRKRLELLTELKARGFTTFPKHPKSTEPVIAVSGEREDDESNEQEETFKGVRAGDYEYLLSMPIGSLTLEKVQSLCSEHDKLGEVVEELRKATPKSLWMRDLEAFLKQLDAQELEEAKEEKYELNYRSKEGERASKRAPSQAFKMASRAAQAKIAGGTSTARLSAPLMARVHAKPPMMDVESEDEGLGLSLRERLAEFSKAGEKSISEEETAIPKKGTPSDRQPRKKMVESDSSEDGNYPSEDKSDGDFVEPVRGKARAAATKKKVVGATPAAQGVGRKVGNINTGTGRGQRLISIMLGASSSSRRQDEARANSPVHKPPAQKGPAQKVQRMMHSPFHKKNGSMLTELKQISEDTTKMAWGALAPPAARPKRANRAVIQYATSEDDEEESLSNNELSSDFNPDDSG